MDLVEAEDKVLEYFRTNGFKISEWPDLHPALEWRPRIHVSRQLYRQQSEAAIVVRENADSYKQAHNWQPLEEARRQLPNLPIYFAIPINISREPLLTELQTLGIGLYGIDINGTLTRIQSDRIPFEDTVISYPIVPDLLYRNRMNLYKVFNNCQGYLWWLDKHFITQGLELLDTWMHCDTPRITEIRLLGSAVVEQPGISRLRRDFAPFKAEATTLGITVDLKIIMDPTIYGNIHDRYIISRASAFNVLPVGSLLKGQHGSLKLEVNPPDFNNLWNIPTNT